MKLNIFLILFIFFGFSLKNLIAMDLGYNLYIAAANNNTELVEELLKKGADVNTRFESQTPLIAAATYPEIVKLLIDKGADVDAQDLRGQTALTRASYKGPIKSVKLLLDAGADIHKRVHGLNGNTAFMEAVIGLQKEIAELFLKNGAKINERDNDGNTALMLVLKGEYEDKDKVTEMVKFLLENGADVTIKNQKGKTALDLAKTNGIKQLIKAHKPKFMERIFKRK